MNRRNFFSLMAGAAGAPLVPWRGLSEPLIILPPDPLVLVTGLEIIQFGKLITRADLTGPFHINTDAAFIPRRKYESALRRFHSQLSRSGISAPMPAEFFERRLLTRELMADRARTA